MKNMGFRHHTLVRSILSTPIYVGKISWAGKTYPEKHEPLVDGETFQRAQDLLDDRARIAASKPAPFRTTHLLSGLLVYGTCGALYFAKKNHHGHGIKQVWVHYYHCYSRAGHKERVIDPACMNHTYGVDMLDSVIIGEIERLVDESPGSGVLSRGFA